MSRIAGRFDLLRSKKEGALVCFVTGGDPAVSQLGDILKALEGAGADVIEVGLPFSDPIADGPIIQASSQRALDRGTKVHDIFAAVKRADVGVPLVYMGYTNVALRHGFDEFASAARESGADGVLLSDMIPEEAGEWKFAAERAGLDTIFLVAPTSTDERIGRACSASSGFVYCVSRTGVTGSKDEMPSDVIQTVERIKRHTSLPVCVGFGISRPEQVQLVAKIAEGAVVGSAIVELLADRWDGGAGASVLTDYVCMLKKAAVLSS